VIPSRGIAIWRVVAAIRITVIERVISRRRHRSWRRPTRPGVICDGWSPPKRIPPPGIPPAAPAPAEPKTEARAEPEPKAAAETPAPKPDREPEAATAMTPR